MAVDSWQSDSSGFGPPDLRLLYLIPLVSSAISNCPRLAVERTLVIDMPGAAPTVIRSQLSRWEGPGVFSGRQQIESAEKVIFSFDGRTVGPNGERGWLRITEPANSGLMLWTATDKSTVLEELNADVVGDPIRDLRLALADQRLEPKVSADEIVGGRAKHVVSLDIRINVPATEEVSTGSMRCKYLIDKLEPWRVELSGRGVIGKAQVMLAQCSYLADESFIGDPPEWECAPR